MRAPLRIRSRHERRAAGLMAGLFWFLVPLGMGAAISPVPTATCLVLLSSNRRPLLKALLFLIGSGAAFLAVGVFSLYVLGGGAGTGERTADLKNAADALIGVSFLAIALRLWLKAPRPDSGPPRWLAGIGSAGPVKAFFFGTVMSATNFSSLPLFLSGLKEILTADIGLTGRVAVLAAFVVLVEAGIIAPIVFYALSPRRAGAVLGAVLRWIEKHDRAVNIGVLLVFGILLLIKGSLGLWEGL